MCDLCTSHYFILVMCTCPDFMQTPALYLPSHVLMFTCTNYTCTPVLIRADIHAHWIPVHLFTPVYCLYVPIVIFCAHCKVYIFFSLQRTVREHRLLWPLCSLQHMFVFTNVCLVLLCILFLPVYTLFTYIQTDFCSLVFFFLQTYLSVQCIFIFFFSLPHH